MLFPSLGPVPRSVELAVTQSPSLEETEVADPRGALRPSQHIEQRVIRVLATAPSFVSQMQHHVKRGSR